MNMLWLTDIHLNFCPKDIREALYLQITTQDPDFIIISGDIAESDSLIDYLEEMVNFVDKPIYFVLGNHDYYHGRINEVREIAAQIHLFHAKLNYISSMEPVEISPHIFLIGQDGWADARAGDLKSSALMSNDPRLIVDLQEAFNTGRTVEEWFNNLQQKMQEMADQDAAALSVQLEKAIQQGATNIHLITHVPPFAELCIGKDLEEYGSDSIYPYFVSVVMGQTLMTFAQQYPDVQLNVYCGHTHQASSYSPVSNLVVRCESAHYQNPAVADIITLEHRYDFKP